MITRIARNDVVRVMRTGEVGTIKGWADHEELDKFGTVLDVEVAKGKTIQANGLALEFVANAKPNYSTAKKVWMITLQVLVVLHIGWTATYLIRTYDMPWLNAVSLAFGAGLLVWEFVFLFTIRPRKTRLRLPKRNVTVGYPGATRPVSGIRKG